MLERGFSLVFPGRMLGKFGGFPWQTGKARKGRTGCSIPEITGLELPARSMQKRAASQSSRTTESQNRIANPNRTLIIIGYQCFKLLPLQLWNRTILNRPILDSESLIGDQGTNTAQKENKRFLLKLFGQLGDVSRKIPGYIPPPSLFLLRVEGHTELVTPHLHAEDPHPTGGYLSSKS